MSELSYNFPTCPDFSRPSWSPTTPMEWPRNRTINLIRAMKVRPSVWNINSDEYRNKFKRHSDLTELAQAFDCNKEDIEKKIFHLRAQYAKELVRVTRSNTYESKWFAFKILSFLNTKRNSSEDSEEEEDQEQVTAKPCRVIIISPRVLSPSNSEEPSTSTGSATMARRTAELSEDKETVVKPENETNGVSSPESHEMYHPVQVKQEVSHTEELVFRNEVPTLELSDSSSSSEEAPLAVLSTSRSAQTIISCANSRAFPIRCVETARQGADSAHHDPSSVFGESVGIQLKNIPDPYARSVAKMNIQRVLCDAEIGLYAACTNLDYNPMAIRPRAPSPHPIPYQEHYSQPHFFN